MKRFVLGQARPWLLKPMLVLVFLLMFLPERWFTTALFWVCIGQAVAVFSLIGVQWTWIKIDELFGVGDDG